MKKILAVLPVVLLAAAYSNVGMATTYAYIANADGNTVTLCTESGTGGFTTCADSGVSTDFDEPVGIAIPDQTFSGNTYAYIANAGENTVSKCQINTSNGTFVDPCADSGAGDSIFDTPIQIAFETTGSVLYAYITDFENKDVTRCTVDSSSGLFGTCGSGVSSIWMTPTAITPQAVNGVMYAYVADEFAPHLSQCTVNENTGELINCFDSGAGPIFGGGVMPQDIAFFTSDSTLYAYVATWSGVYLCDVDATTGQFSDCNTTGGLDSIPNTAIEFVTLGGNSYAYVTSGYEGTYSQCSIAGDGELTCDGLSTLPSAALGGQQGLAAFAVNGVDYVYVANPFLNTISQCLVYPSGELGAAYCVDSGLGDSVFSSPNGITLYQFSSGDIFAYVVGGEGVAWRCPVDSTTGQLLDDCSGYNLTLDSSKLQSVVLAEIDSNVYAYITDDIYAGGQIWFCDVNTSTGALSSCDDLGDSLSNPIGLAFYAYDSPTLYVVTGSDDYFFLCTLNTDGTLDSCASGGANAAVPTHARGIWVTGSNAYVAGYNNVYGYTLDGDGSPTFYSANAMTGMGDYPGLAYVAGDSDTIIISQGEGLLQCFEEGYYVDCVKAGLNGAPFDVAFQIVDSTPYAYFALYGPTDGTYTGAVLVCNLDEETGSLTLCLPTAAGIPVSELVLAIAFQTAGENNYAYIVSPGLSGGGAVSQCLQDPSSGLLSGCQNAGAGDIGSPQFIAFATEIDGFSYAYIGDVYGVVFQCLVDPDTGLFDEPCTSTGSVFGTPFGIAFNNNYAYVTDPITDRVVKCSLTGTALSACADSGAGTLFKEPVDIAFFMDTDDNINAYITNVNNDDCIPPYNSVTFCAVDSDTGLLSDCNDSTAGSVFDAPAGIAFSSSSSYAYVTNSDSSNNTISQCSLNSDGSFNLCGDSGVGATYFDKPFGITFFTP